MTEAAERNSIHSPESELRLAGRVLWLTKDPDLLRKQLEGRNLAYVPPEELADNVSTDEIIPSKHCLNFAPEDLGEFALTGFRGNVIRPGDIRNGGFEAVIFGASGGCGSAREHAPIALKGAGIRFIAGEHIERIFLSNSQNQGLSPIIEPEILERLLSERKIDREQIAVSFDPISADVIRHGGLLLYLKARIDGKVKVPEINTDSERPMTIAEKILAAHWVNPDGSVGTEAVKPGDAGFIKSDFSYSYEIMTPLSEAALNENFENIEIQNPETIALFEDHTEIAEQLKKNPETAPLVSRLLTTQRRFAVKNGIKLYPPDTGICHNKMAEDVVLPGQVVLGTDSHTCSEGVNGAFANGIGATEMAGVWITTDCRITVPQSWQFMFTGKLQDHVMAKDIMLYIFSLEKFRKGQAVGKFLEYTGEGLENLSHDELFVLPNMSVEGGAFTGIVEPNKVIINFLLKRHPNQDIKSMIVKSDLDAIYEKTFDIDLSEIPLMVAKPGDPRNSVPLVEAAGIKTDTVYVGSCTGGSLNDLEKAAHVFQPDPNKPVRKAIIPTFIQANTGQVRSKAEKAGFISIFREAEATILESGCGDCCNLGLGIAQKGQVIVSDTNRNFPGRMGPADVYLVNPEVAATTAVLGHLPTPQELQTLSKAT